MHAVQQRTLIETPMPAPMGSDTAMQIHLQRISVDGCATSR